MADSPSKFTMIICGLGFFVLAVLAGFALQGPYFTDEERAILREYERASIAFSAQIRSPEFVD